MNQAIENTVKATMKANADQLLNEFQQGLNAKKLASHQKLVEHRQRYSSFYDKKLTCFFKEFNGMVYEAVTEDGRFLVMAFANQAKKPVFYYSFNDENKKNDFIVNWAVSQVKKVNLKLKRQAEKKRLQENALQFVNVGDIFRSSWGYEQTNIDYYQVTAIKGKSTVTLQEIKAKIVEETCHDTGKKLPVKNGFIGEAFDKRITLHGFRDGKANISVSLSSFQNAYLKHPLPNGNYSPDDYSSYY